MILKSEQRCPAYRSVYKTPPIAAPGETPPGTTPIARLQGRLRKSDVVSVEVYCFLESSGSCPSTVGGEARHQQKELHSRRPRRRKRVIQTPTPCSHPDLSRGSRHTADDAISSGGTAPAQFSTKTSSIERYHSKAQGISMDFDEVDAPAPWS